MQTIIISVVIAVLIVISLGIIFYQVKKKNFQDSKVSSFKDRNPTYGDVVEYEGYYIETKATDENEDYNKSQHGEDGEYIRSEIKETNQFYVK